MYRAIAGHRLVVETARSLAGEIYDQLMQNDQLWKAWQSQHPGVNRRELERRFVIKYTPQCIEQARATLALILRDPTKAALHPAIEEALILDHTLRAQRANAPIVQEAGNVR